MYQMIFDIWQELVVHLPFQWVRQEFVSPVKFCHSLRPEVLFSVIARIVLIYPDFTC